MSAYPAIALATLTVVQKKPAPDGPALSVHFNPASLQLTLSSELKDNSKNGPKQYIAKATAKLKFELIFDTTDTGQSVLLFTSQLQSLVIPPNFKAPDKKHPTQVPPPTVKFDWGAIAFQGVAEGYQETIDFFSADGVPLRATVNLTLSQQDKIFEDRKGKTVEGGVTDDGSGIATAVGTSPDKVANDVGSPDAARGLAAANGAESLRATFAGELAVGAEVSLSGPVAFASAGGSFGASAGGGLGLELGGGVSASLGGGINVGISGGISGGVSAGIGGSFSAGASVGFSAGISGGASASFGASAGAGFAASAGVGGGASLGGLARLSATEGAFAGLRAGAVLTTSAPRVDVEAFRLRASASATLSTDAGATFRVGGRANLSGPSGLRADVGGNVSAAGRLTFD